MGTFPNNAQGPPQGGGPLQNMPPGMMAGPGMIGGGPQQNMPPGMMGPGGPGPGGPGGPGVLGGGPGHPNALPGVSAGPGGPGGPGGQTGPAGGRSGGPGPQQMQFSVSNPLPNMPQRPNSADCNNFIKHGGCRFGQGCK